MAAERQFAFDRFRIDARTGQLWCDGNEVKLTPRAAAVLELLARRAEQLVTKQELFEVVWGGIPVGDDALTSCIRELRNALSDDARRPRYIETRHRRGYRLMLPVVAAAELTGASAPSPATSLVGREAEFAQLLTSFGQVREGRRQIVFLTGEPGIGKSALAAALREHLHKSGHASVAQGQCVDHHGAGEAYLPLIEAFTRLASGPDGAAVKAVLSSHAPGWLAQMPSLWTRAERAALQARGSATREGMMRELTLAVETIAAHTPLLLMLEDLHWSDASTLEWIAQVARRPEAARLLVIATYRPADAAAKPMLRDLTTELGLHRHCTEVALVPLDRLAVAAFLRARLIDMADEDGVGELASALQERTGGNPLFMTSIVNQLALLPAATRTPAAIGSIPHDVRRYIDRQIDGLAETDLRLLAVASVVGRDFATAAVSAALPHEAEQIEADCARLARQGIFLTRAGSVAWPDGTQAERYAFRHDLYRELIYDRLSPSRRALSHRQVGRRLECAWAAQLDAIASELAEHFERARDPARAVPHHQRAAIKALRRGANEEALGHLRRALEGIGHIKDVAERGRLEVELRVALGAAYMATRGFGAPEVRAAYARASELCDRLGDDAALFPALWGQWLFRWGRSEMDEAGRLSKRLLSLAGQSGNVGLRLQAHHAAWATSFGRGDLAQVFRHVHAGLALYDQPAHQAMASSYGNHDASACAHNFAAMSLALAGRADEARRTAEGSVALATGLGDPFSLALTHYFSAVAAQIIDDVSMAMRNAGASRTLASEHGLALPKAWSTSILGWCATRNGEWGRGIMLLREGIAALRATESRHFLAYLLGLLGEACLTAGRHEDARQAVAEGIALAEASGERYYLAALHRLHGEFLARSPRDARQDAAAAFQAAIAIATKQGALALARKADESLRHW